jgi:hypothetical protein
VVDNVAYFGVSVFSPRNVRTDPSMDSELAAFDLSANALKWKRTVRGGGGRGGTSEWLIGPAAAAGFVLLPSPD